MKKQILNVKGSSILSKKAQQEINGGAGGGGTPDMEVCGCDCTGSVTGPKYCKFIISCPQVITC